MINQSVCIPSVMSVDKYLLSFQQPFFVSFAEFLAHLQGTILGNVI